MKNDKKAYTLGAFAYILGTAVLFAIFLLMIAINNGAGTTEYIKNNTNGIVLICISLFIVSGITYCYFYFENKKYILRAGKIAEVFLLQAVAMLASFLIGKYVNPSARPMVFLPLMAVTLLGRREAIFLNIVSALQMFILDNFSDVTGLFSASGASISYNLLIVAFCTGMIGIFVMPKIKTRIGSVLIAFVGYANNFWNPVINIGNFYNQLITCSAYLERIFETLDVVPEIRNKENACDLPQIRGRVDFNDVVFRYEEGGRNILNLVDFHVEPGRTIALVGPTGAGKTTIISLLSRFYDVSEGSVTIDGYDVRDVTLESLRRQMGVMLQDTFIFSGNVRENIRYGKLDATDEQIEAAAKAVHAHEFIMELPDGYDTVVEERGSTLSAGQRQLIAFARVLLADPRILILDEATSNIDTRTEEALQAGLNHLLKGRTSFIIAHRLSTIENADEIFYIDHGQIMEHGSHDELLAQKGAYYRLYESQYAMIRAAHNADL